MEQELRRRVLTFESHFWLFSSKMSSNAESRPFATMSGLSESDRDELLSRYAPNRKDETSPLLVLSPADLSALSRRQAEAEQEEQSGEAVVWEELANAFLVTIPFCFLYVFLSVQSTLPLPQS